MRKEALCFPLSSLVLLSLFPFFSLVLGLEFLFWVRRFGVSFPSPSFLRYDLDILVKLLIII